MASNKIDTVWGGSSDANAKGISGAPLCTGIKHSKQFLSGNGHKIQILSEPMEYADFRFRTAYHRT